ncbi:hypothetical protein Tco_1100232 [Tanacetum coccineum]
MTKCGHVLIRALQTGHDKDGNQDTSPNQIQSKWGAIEIDLQANTFILIGMKFNPSRSSRFVKIVDPIKFENNLAGGLQTSSNCAPKRKRKDPSEDKSEHSPQYPPGYTPKDGIETFCNNGENSKKECGEFLQGGHEEGVNDVFKDIGSNKGSKDDVAESVCSGHFKKSVNPRTGGSILNLMEELVKVGQTMGYNMDGCMNNMTEIIESQGVKEGFR